MMDSISIGYFADGPWSHNAFKLLNDDPTIDIKFIVPRADTTDTTLKKYAEENNIYYFLHPNINAPDFIERVEAFNCDLFVSMSFNQIFREQIFKIPRLKTINCHAGKLPFYRGRNILNWALINDEKEFGITVHYVDEGIDTGDIILQETYPITDEDDYGTLLNKAYTECADILYSAVKLLQKDEVKSIKQTEIHPVGFYCGKRGLGDEIIDWNQSSRELFNFIRAVCKPGPMATTYKNGEQVKINKARIIPNAPEYKNIPGQILSKTENGFLVKTGDSFIEINEISSDIKLMVGDRLG